jgi:hypothetical protein
MKLAHKMARKSKLESDFHHYSTLLANMRQFKKANRFQEALTFAIASLDYIDGMMQFDRKFGKQSQFHSIDTIDFVLKHAPMLFDVESIDNVEALLKAKRTIEKNTTANLAELITAARSSVWEAYRLWTLFEQATTVTEEHFGREPSLRSIMKFWMKVGLVHQTSTEGDSSYELTTQLTDKVRGKCPLCGATGSGTKVRLLEKITCPKCKEHVSFVLLAN